MSKATIEPTKVYEHTSSWDLIKSAKELESSIEVTLRTTSSEETDSSSANKHEELMKRLKSLQSAFE